MNGVKSDTGALYFPECRSQQGKKIASFYQELMKSEGAISDSDLSQIVAHSALAEGLTKVTDGPFAEEVIQINITGMNALRNRAVTIDVLGRTTTLSLRSLLERWQDTGKIRWVPDEESTEQKKIFLYLGELFELFDDNHEMSNTIEKTFQTFLFREEICALIEMLDLAVRAPPVIIDSPLSHDFLGGVKERIAKILSPTSAWKLIGTPECCKAITQIQNQVKHINIEDEESIDRNLCDIFCSYLELGVRNQQWIIQLLSESEKIVRIVLEKDLYQRQKDEITLPQSYPIIIRDLLNKGGRKTISNQVEFLESLDEHRAALEEISKAKKTCNDIFSRLKITVSVLRPRPPNVFINGTLKRISDVFVRNGALSKEYRVRKYLEMALYVKKAEYYPSDAHLNRHLINELSQILECRGLEKSLFDDLVR